MHAPRINLRTPQKGDLKMFFRIVRAITNRIIRVIILIIFFKIKHGTLHILFLSLSYQSYQLVLVLDRIKIAFYYF